MSWVIEIVPGDVPSDDAEAWKYLEDLREEDDATLDERHLPTGKMLELYHRVTERYPCIMEDPNGPWSDGPLINNFSDRLTAVGFVTSKMAEAFPFVIETATEMGFTVFDGGDERIYRPKGWKATTAPSVATVRPWWRFWS